MSVYARYEAALAAAGYAADSSQLETVAALDRVRTELETRRRRGRLARVLSGRSGSTGPVRGAYLWGGVGRGKTFVMDLFFDALPFADKQRFHFHRLMYRVHARLRALGNTRDPIAIVADELAEQARVICFDEFFVADIADAMLLGRLLDALFAREVTLVATSNIPPDELYQDGLQREQFVPAINLLKQHTEIINLDAGTDYRLRVLEQAAIWHTPLGTAAEQQLQQFFAAIAPDQGSSGQSLEILGRDVATVRRADGIAWFDFAELCGGPRSQNDYIELARIFQTVLVSDIPLLDREREDETRRFIALVDEFYARRVKLAVSAAAPPGELYTGARLRMEFERTCSRLVEMQSRQYLALPHLP